MSAQDDVPSVEEQRDNAVAYALAARKLGTFFMALSIAEAVVILVLIF